jgi:hypothetical protein
MTTMKRREREIELRGTLLIFLHWGKKWVCGISKMVQGE